MAHCDDVENQHPRLDVLNPVDIETYSWHLAIHDKDNKTVLLDPKPLGSTTTMDAVRGHVWDHPSKNWLLRLLLRLATLEAHVAIVEAIMPKASHIEIATRGCTGCPVLTAALCPAKKQPIQSPSGPQPSDTLAIRLLPPESVKIGSKVIVFYASCQGVRKGLELCAIALIGLLFGCLAGFAAGEVDVGIATAAAWLQFAQLYQFSRRV
ncbi:MAG: hypothetical protein Q9171_004627 [Xanthocarpia ochracea]